jgi:ParB family chromosome partitioning protein
MQPIVLRPKPAGEGYELVAGERRWRAAQRLGLATVPAIVRELDDRQIAEWAVIENLQREDLDPLERATAFARLADHFALTHQEIADRIGIDRTTVTNFIRLLDLHEDIQELVRKDRLTGGHVRCLLSIADPAAQVALAKRAVAAGWSVRKMEQVVKRQAGPQLGTGPAATGRSAHLLDLERQIAQQLNTKVHIKPGRRKNAGTLMIDYYDLDQFDALMAKLGVNLD